VVTFPTVSTKAPVTPNTDPSSDQKSKTHPPKPYDIVQGMERVIGMMEETLQICKRAQRSTQDGSRRKTFPFGLRPSSDAHARHAAKSIQIQSRRWESSGDLKIEPRTCRDPLNILCTYHKGARHTLRGCRLRKNIDRERDASNAVTPMSPDIGEFQKARIRISPNDQRSIRWRVLVVLRTNHHGSVSRTPRRHVRSKAMRTAPRGGRSSSAKRYLHAPATYPRVRRGGASDVQ
jgi:hypothetical protein